jgi:hypothetical protein
MFASRASEDRPLTSRAYILSSSAMWLHDFWLARDARWIAGMALLYVLAVGTAVLTLNPYFSQTWDVVTFAHAARSFLNGADWAGLYAQSRLERYWPYAYPPLHALAIAPLLAIGSGVPDWLWARVPPLIADLATGLLLYSIVARRAQERPLARLALAVWLLNPVTFYDTAVQGHFEAEWLFFVLLAYLLAESRHGMLLPTLSLACGFLLKQTVIIFALPYWLWLIASNGHAASPSAGLSYRLAMLKRFIPAAASVALFTVVVLLASLPFLLDSGDYLYMTLQYVADVPVQTQSWLVALAGIFGPDFLLLRLSSLLVLLASVVISFLSARRGSSLYLTATLIALAFFLLSQKVVGYYYVILLPFALVAFLPARRFGLLASMVASTAYISLSPYSAPWANPNHLPVYAALGVANSLLWLALFVYLWRDLPLPLLIKEGRAADSPLLAKKGQGEVKAIVLVFVSAALFLEAVATAVLQPLVNNPTSPIRAPIVPPGLESNVLLASIVFAAIILAVFTFAIVLTRRRATSGGGQTHSYLPRGVFAIALFLAPLYFLTFTLTKESTTFVEIALKSLGL